MVSKFLEKKIGLGIIINEQLAEELHKPGIKKWGRRQVHARFKDNTWASDLAEMEWFSTKKKSVKYLLCAIDVFAKYAKFKPLKDQKRWNSSQCFHWNSKLV